MNKRKIICRTIFRLLLCSAILAGCSSKAKNTEVPKSITESNQLSQASTTSNKTNKNSTGYTKDEYDLIISLKSNDYANLSVEDFNTHIRQKMYDPAESQKYLESYSNVFENISEEDENYTFVRRTLELTNGEIYSEQFENQPYYIYIKLSKTRESKIDEIDGGMRYSFSFLAPCNIYYTISDLSKITVGERDKLFLEYENKLRYVIDNLSEEELLSKDIKDSLKSKFDTISDEMSNDLMTFKYELTEIDTYYESDR